MLARHSSFVFMYSTRERVYCNPRFEKCRNITCDDSIVIATDTHVGAIVLSTKLYIVTVGCMISTVYQIIISCWTKLHKSIGGKC